MHAAPDLMWLWLDVWQDLFQSLVPAVYGDDPGHFAEGQWTAAASEIVRCNPKVLQKFLPMQERACRLMSPRCCGLWLWRLHDDLILHVVLPN